MLILLINIKDREDYGNFGSKLWKFVDQVSGD